MSATLASDEDAAADPLIPSLLTWAGDGACPLTVYTVATKWGMGVHNMLASLRRYGYRYRVIGWGEPWRGWRQRMEWYAQAAEAHHPHDVILFSDAFDVVAARGHGGLLEWFLAQGAPVVTGMERLCLDNCGDVGAWWEGARRTPASNRKYVNGGVVMGRAGALAAAYRWILDHPTEHYTDDQIGLAAYFTAHPQQFAPDDASTLVRNKMWCEAMTGEERDGAGAYFVHYPGLGLWPPFFNIQEAWRTHAGPLAVVDPPTSAHWTAWRRVLRIGLLVLLFVLGFVLGQCLAARATPPSSLVSLKLASAPSASTGPVVHA